MEANWAGRLSATFCALWIPAVAAGQGPSPTGGPVPEIRPAVPAPGANPAPAPPASATLTDPDAARTDARQRLDILAKAGDKEPVAGSKALTEVLKERLELLDNYQEAVKARLAIEHPEKSPEREASDLKAAMDRVKAALDQATRDPDSLLPEAFRTVPAHVTEKYRGVLKDALESAQNDLKEWTAKLEKLRTEASEPLGAQLAPLRAERDKFYRHVATLKTRRAERADALAKAQSAEERGLARERLINFEWETRFEQERLQGQEARIALETQRADLAALRVQILGIHVQTAKKTLELMQERYLAVSERVERALKQAADTEEKRATKTDDPLERFRARHQARLIELRMQIVKTESAKAPMTSSVDEQKALADRADANCAGIKKLLDDGKVSHLDALRLNNDFRRIGPEREQIVKTELATAARVLTYYENALSGVELAQINDARDDRYEFEALLETLPRARHAEAQATFDTIESEHAQELEKYRALLGELAMKAEQRHEQIERRVRILDDQYGFIRTHIFWVRDQDQIGAVVVRQAQRELSNLGKGLFRSFIDARDPVKWGRVSVEFALGALATLLLPWPFFRIRRWLRPARPGRRQSTTLTPA